MKPKNKDDVLGDGWLNRALDEIVKKRGEHIASRFYVVEVTPPKAYRSGDGHGGTELNWTARSTKRVSKYFNTKPQAEHFLTKYDPDDGNVFEIREDKLYRRVVEEWY